MEKKNWLKILFKYASSEKIKMVFSIILSIISVISGLVPFYCMYRIIFLFVENNININNALLWCGIS